MTVLQIDTYMYDVRIDIYLHVTYLLTGSCRYLPQLQTAASRITEICKLRQNVLKFKGMSTNIIQVFLKGVTAVYSFHIIMMTVTHCIICKIFNSTALNFFRFGLPDQSNKNMILLNKYSKIL